MTATVEWLPYRPSNGSEGECFRDEFCDQCEHDRLYRETDGNAPLNADGTNGCSIIARTMAYEVTDPLYPVEWRRRADATEYPDAECTAFEPERPAGSPPKETRCTLTKELFE